MRIIRKCHPSAIHALHPSLAAQCSVAHNWFLMAGHEHDEITISLTALIISFRYWIDSRGYNTLLFKK